MPSLVNFGLVVLEKKSKCEKLRYGRTDGRIDERQTTADQKSSLEPSDQQS